MSFLLTPEFWARWIGIVIIDLTLAGDNAIVIALATRKLPTHQRFYGRLWGTLGAVGFRLAGIAIVSLVLRIPLVQLLGGLALIWIAVQLVRHKDEGPEQVHAAANLWQAVWVIVQADVLLSLDNVIAIAAAAHGSMPLVIFGIAFSLPLVVYGSGLLEKLMSRFVWIVWLGGGVLGYAAGEMMTHDPMVVRWIGAERKILDHAVPIALALTLTALGWWFEHRHVRRKKKSGAS